MRPDAQPTLTCSRKAPRQITTERKLEREVHAARHRVCHLLVKQGIGCGRISPVLHEQEWLFKIDLRVMTAAGRVEIHDLEQRAGWPGRERLVRHTNGCDGAIES